MAQIRDKRILCTFPTTTQALYMEKCCREEEVPGRLIPVPGEISAGCGMGWLSEPEFRPEIENLVKKAGIQAEKIYEIEW